MTIVDENEIHPELKKDIFWNQTEPEFIEQPDVNDAEKLGISEDFVFQQLKKYVAEICSALHNAQYWNNVNHLKNT